MTYISNDPNCVLQRGNTGIPTCSMEPGLEEGGILCDISTSLTPAEILAIKTNLQALTLVSGKSRIYPLPRFFEITDTTEEPVEVKSGLGFSQIVMEGKQIRTYQFVEGGQWLLTKLRKFNKKNNLGMLYFAKVDDGKQINGTKDADGNTRPFTLSQFYAYPVKRNNGKDGTVYRFKVVEADPAEWDNYSFIPVDFNPLNEIKGITDLTLTADTPNVDTVNVTIKTSADFINVYPDLGDLFADINAWVLTKKDTGVVTPITSVNKVPGIQDKEQF